MCPTVQLAPPFNHDYSSASKKLISTVAICAGAGGSVLKDHDAEVYFTGEMFHVWIIPSAFAEAHYLYSTTS
jgi:putative NIF3 family GTP cyclohydrolase 1 type 2